MTTEDDNITAAIQFAEDNAAADPEFVIDEQENDNAITEETPPTDTSAGDTPPTGDNPPVATSGAEDGAAQPQPAETSAQPVSSNQLTSDKDGNFVDENGKIVARAGSERRMFERAQRSDKNARHFQQLN